MRALFHSIAYLTTLPYPAQRKRKTKSNALEKISQTAVFHNEDFVKAFHGPPDEPPTEWYHFTISKQKMRSLSREIAKGKHFLRAVSPPFVKDGKVLVECKWVKAPDTDNECKPVLELLQLFNDDEAWLEFISFRLLQLPAAACKQITKHLTRVEVRPPNISLQKQNPIRQDYDVGGMVLIKQDKHKHLPRWLFSHMLFKLTQVPKATWYFKTEPKWGEVRPCDTSGKSLRGSQRVSIRLSWIQSGFFISQDEDHHTRQELLNEYTMSVLQTNHHPRIQVTATLPYSIFLSVLSVPVDEEDCGNNHNGRWKHVSHQPLSLWQSMWDDMRGQYFDYVTGRLKPSMHGKQFRFQHFFLQDLFDTVMSGCPTKRTTLGAWEVFQFGEQSPGDKWLKALLGTDELPSSVRQGSKATVFDVREIGFCEVRKTMRVRCFVEQSALAN